VCYISFLFFKDLCFYRKQLKVLQNQSWGSQQKIAILLHPSSSNFSNIRCIAFHGNELKPSLLFVFLHYLFLVFLICQCIKTIFSFPGFATEHKSMSADVIRKAFQETEEGFLSLVSKEWSFKPQIASVGSCCLVGVICAGTLYVANLGDSRAVLGRLVKATGEVLATQLSAEHNACYEEVRQELQSSHPDDPRIVVLKHNVWRVKGLIQVHKNLYP
jgi:hypothetical protein